VTIAGGGTVWPFGKKDKSSLRKDASLEERRIAERFREILAAEHENIAARRSAHGRGPVAPEVPGMDERGELPVFDTAGVALSGGGIRSAAFCLGALQSLAARDLIGQIDYLSTVSGGGYTGASVSAAMSLPPAKGSAFQDFPFAAPREFRDRPAVGHLRDFSNYLLPRGSSSFIDAIAVVLRGLAVNMVFVIAGVTFLVSATLVAYPDIDTLGTGSFLPRYFEAWFGHNLNATVGPCPFALTGWVALLLGIYMIAWGLWRSLTTSPGSDVRGGWIVGARRLAILLIVVAALDLQPVAIDTLRQWSAEWQAKGFAGWFATITAPFAAVVAFFSDKLASVLKTAGQRQDWTGLIQRVAAKALILAAAAVLPILLWLLYLSAFLWTVGFTENPVKHPGLFGLNWPMPVWGTPWLMSDTWAVFWLAAVLWSIAFAFGRNANSLHQLYRDKLSKAFLFDPKWRETSGPDADDLVPRDDCRLTDIAPATGGPYQLINATINLQGSKFANRRGRNGTFFLFSAGHVGSSVTGYVETAEVQRTDPHIDLGSAMAISGAAVSSNMGSASIRPLTPTLTLLNIRLGYWMVNPKFFPKDTLEKLVSRTVSYGMKIAPGIIGNPLYRLASRSRGLAELMPANTAGTLGELVRPSLHQLVQSLRQLFSKLTRFYLFSETFGRLDETKPDIYLTDGGHIENLGLYQLLARRCRAIIVVDGESDPTMSFNALSIVQRYARIDLGIRIDIPWQEIARVSNEATRCAKAGDPIPVANGPHCAVGAIHYSDGSDGLLLYVKASVTGDEADYVVNYKQRNPVFPHESTGDQFFTEEQFEVYRALGFHAMDGFFGGGQGFAWLKTGPWPNGTFATADEIRAAFRAALGVEL